MEIKFIQRLMEAIEVAGFRVVTYINEMLIRLSHGKKEQEASETEMLVRGVVALLQIR